jgi:hypothetical protein
MQDTLCQKNYIGRLQRQTRRMEDLIKSLRAVPQNSERDPNSPPTGDGNSTARSAPQHCPSHPNYTWSASHLSTPAAGTGPAGQVRSGNLARRLSTGVPLLVVLTLGISESAVYAGEDNDVSPSSRRLFWQSTRRPK